MSVGEIKFVRRLQAEAKKACAACAAGRERIVRAGAHLLVIVVVRVVADDDEGRVNEAKGDEGVRDLLPLVGLGCERRGQVADK